MRAALKRSTVLQAGWVALRAGGQFSFRNPFSLMLGCGRSGLVLVTAVTCVLCVPLGMADLAF